MSTPPKKKERNLYREAFLNQYNLLFLGFFVLASAILFSPWPFLVGVGLEIVYMLFVPDSALFKSYVAARDADEAEAARARELAGRLDALPGPQRERYDSLAQLIERTRANLRKSQADAMHRAMIDKLNTLQTRFLAIMELANAYTLYLDTVRGQDLDKVERDLERQLEAATGRVKRAVQERLEVIRKRKARMEQVRENQLVVVNQIHTVEDIMRLIFESSLSMQNPQGLSQQLDDLLIDVEATEESVGDLRANDDALADEIERLGASLDPDVDAPSLPPEPQLNAAPAHATTRKQRR